MHPLSGTYALVYRASIEAPVQIGKLGTLLLKPGFYVYVGSAFGPGGLKARLHHHLSGSRRPHWHIDFLYGCLHPLEIWYTYDPDQHEHQWAKTLEQTRGACTVLAGFGSSDCSCRTHFFFFNSKPSGRYFKRKAHALSTENVPIKIATAKNFLTKIH